MREICKHLTSTTWGKIYIVYHWFTTSHSTMPEGWKWQMMSCKIYQHSSGNSLATGRCGSKFKYIFFKHIVQNSSLYTGWEIPLRWIPQTLTKEKSSLAQIIAWCHQATSHYLNHFTQIILPYGITRPQWVKSIFSYNLIQFYSEDDGLIHQWPLLLTWFNFNPSMDK